MSNESMINYPKNGLPYFAALPYYLWGEVNYNSDGDCKSPLDKSWSYLDVYDRDTSHHFVIQVNEDRTKLTISGDEKSVAGLIEFFSDTPNENALKRVDVVNYCFEHPNVQKFAVGHSFWGSWKWVGLIATEFTTTGRWLMLDAMRESSKGAWIALKWMKSTSIQQQKQALLEHLMCVCKCDSSYCENVFSKLEEPDEEEYENELIEYYKTILEKLNCSNDPLMLLSCDKTPHPNIEGGQYNDSSEDNSENDCSDGDKLAYLWSLYGIDIYSENAIELFKKQGMPILENCEGECSYNKTKQNFMVQPSYTCDECYPNDISKGVCEFCAKECRQKAHKLGNVKYTPFFCDKGYDNNID